ncbi:hypothetical protein GCM10022419_107690 [Nonomuraea rosea]|uniref:Uncharacterized protein n=1 Tax=Nonomuraea rosea TaxID=638574 RepID=A0ABP6ZCL2_9ACTN
MSELPEGTGDERVDAIVAALGPLGELPVSEHVAVFGEAFSGLEATLAAAGDDELPSGGDELPSGGDELPSGGDELPSGGDVRFPAGDVRGGGVAGGQARGEQAERRR